MLRKILTIAFILVLVVTFGCKKAEKPPTTETTITDLQKQVEKDSETAKEKAGQKIEKAGKEIQKDANAQAQ